VVETCVATWFFGENRIGRSTVKEEGKRKAEKMLLSWLLETSDEDMDYL